MDSKEFRNIVIRNRDKGRVHKVSNSYGVYDAFKFYRKNKPSLKQYVLTESQYFSIIRKINELMGEELLFYCDLKLPSRLGRLEIRKYPIKHTINEEGKLQTNAPIDWDRVLKWWAEDNEAYKNKQLLYLEIKELYRTYYNKSEAKYKNKSFYQFSLNRDLKRRMSQLIKEGKIDAFETKKLYG